MLRLRIIHTLEVGDLESSIYSSCMPSVDWLSLSRVSAVDASSSFTDMTDMDLLGPRIVDVDSIDVSELNFRDLGGV